MQNWKKILKDNLLTCLSCFRVHQYKLAGLRSAIAAAILMLTISKLLGTACTKTRNAGTPERRNTKTRNTKLLKPGTHEN